MISQLGDSFVKKNPRILQDIERGLYVLMKSVQPGTLENKQTVNLGNNRAMHRLAEGGQSKAFMLEVNGNKFVIKIKQTTRTNNLLNDVYQPYFNEMLQTQTFARDFKNELEKVGIIMPEFLFASGTLSCTSFIEGKHPTQEKLASILTYKFLQKIISYLESRKQDLWKDITIDFYNFLLNQFKIYNFIEREDGKLVWIDPFSPIP